MDASGLGLGLCVVLHVLQLHVVLHELLHDLLIVQAIELLVLYVIRHRSVSRAATRFRELNAPKRCTALTARTAHSASGIDRAMERAGPIATALSATATATATATASGGGGGRRAGGSGSGSGGSERQLQVPERRKLRRRLRLRVRLQRVV